MGETQNFWISVRGHWDTARERIEWPLEGPTVRSLVDELLARRGAARLPGDARGMITLGGRAVTSVDVALGVCLSATMPERDPSQIIELVIDLDAGRASAPAMSPAPRPRPAGGLSGGSLPPVGSAPHAPGSLGMPPYAPAPVGPPVPFGSPPVPVGRSAPFGSPHAPAPPVGSPSLPGGLPVGMPAPSAPPQAPPPASPEGLTNQPAPQPAPQPAHDARATVEYFTRMTPQRVFPLKVTLAPEAPRRALAPGVARAESEAFSVDASKPIEVEPVLPGCTVYPAKQTVPAGATALELRFWVVPQVKGEIPGAVYVRHGPTHRVVQLEITVAEPRAAGWTAAAGVVLPYVSVLMKHERVDFESQVADGFPAYLTALRALQHVIGPTELCVALLIAAAALWALRRPRKATARVGFDAPLYSN